MWRKILFVVLLSLLAAPAFAGWQLDGYDVTLSYTVPVPPGFTATKEKVTVNVSKEKVPETVTNFRAMMEDIQSSFEGADPYKGWAPFTWGINYGPRWKQVP